MEDQMPKLFGLFQQLDSTTNQPKGGTGLGIAISKAIVEQHGGTIDVETTAGKGSTFFFDIPAVKQMATDESSDESSEKSSAESSAKAPEDEEEDDAAAEGTDYVLLVEDDEKLTEVLKQLLESENYRVKIARTIGEADRKIKRSLPKVVILDVHLPDGNGLDWMKRLRESKTAENVPVVVLTGQEADDSYGLPLLIDWLRKPVDIKQLLHALKRGVTLSATSPQVLIVEDDASTREILVHQLGQAGIKAMEASSGSMALQMVQDHNPDLIILDLGLPGFDGFELVKRLEQGGSKTTPLLVYTSRDLSNADMERLQLGLSKHLIKSKTSQAQFVNAVRELLTSVLLPR
jgi:DNA-binding response OmpR family regulator